jgi:hypothetical protein
MRIDTMSCTETSVTSWENGSHFMIISSKAILAALAATILLGLGVSSATARRLENSTQGFRVVWLLETPLEMSNNIGLETTRCGLTLEGTLHSRTFQKVSGSLIGYVTRAILHPAERCTGGKASIFTESLPWHTRFLTFEGTLPTITSVSLALIGARFRVQPTGGPICNSRTSAAEPGIGTFSLGAGGVIERATMSGSIRLEGEGLCSFGAVGTFGGTTTDMFVLGTTTRISIRLI